MNLSMQTPICDIIVLSWNHPELTQACVQSVLENTKLPVRLIIVDNGSNEETKAILRTFKGTDTVQFEFLYNPANLGFPKGCNQGIQISQAQYICLLNNDTVVYPHWLSEMIQTAESNPQIGIVNPASNAFGEPPDRIPPEKIMTEMGSCIGFCMLIKRVVIDKIGLLDEGYEQAYYEDIDYCLSAKKEGFLCVMAHHAYVSHVGEASSPHKNPSYVQRNRRYFFNKWGAVQRILYPLCLDRSWVESPQLSQTLNFLVSQTRKKHIFIDLLCYNPHGYTVVNLFHRANLMEHADIHLLSCNGTRILFPWKVLWQALLKRKKPYGFYGSPHPFATQLLNRTGWFHRMKPLKI